MDVLIVGSGPAALAAAALLGRRRERGQDLRIMVLEGSSCRVRPKDPTCIVDLEEEAGLEELGGIPDACLGPRIEKEEILWLTSRGARKRPFSSHQSGSGGRLVAPEGLMDWLRGLAREGGVDLRQDSPAAGLLYDEKGVRGVVSSGGSDGRGKPRRIEAKITCIADGAGGRISRQLIRDRHLDEGRPPGRHAAVIEEIWEVPEASGRAGRTWRSFGWPLPGNRFGSGRLTCLPKGRLAVLFAVSLADSASPVDPWSLYELWRSHPRWAGLLEGGRPVSRFAGLMPEAGYWSIPKLAAPGALLTGAAAGLADLYHFRRLQPALVSGVLAGEVMAEALTEGDVSAPRLMAYDRRLRDSTLGQRLYDARNYLETFQPSRLAGLRQLAVQAVTGGRGLRERRRVAVGTPQRPLERPPVLPLERHFPRVPGWGELEIGPLTGRRPSTRPGAVRSPPIGPRLLDPGLCSSRCPEEFGCPCGSICPSGVFVTASTPDGGAPVLEGELCMQCRFCEEADPYGVIKLTS